MSAMPSRWCWRKDLSGFRGLSERDKAGFLMTLEWFENFRLRRELPAGREAVRAFWRAEVRREEVKREDWSRKGLRPTRLSKWRRAVPRRVA